MNPFYGFFDGACRHNLNLALASWVLYSQANDLVSSGGVCLGLATNNIIEYLVLIGLLNEASSCDMNHLVIFLDSQLVVSHLNHVYTIRNRVLLRLF